MPFLARFFHITFFLISSWINHAQDIPSSQLIISQRISKGSLEQNTHFFLILPFNVPYLHAFANENRDWQTENNIMHCWFTKAIFSNFKSPKHSYYYFHFLLLSPYLSLCSLQGSFQPVCCDDHLFSDAKFRALIMSSDDCLMTSIHDDSCI